MCVRMTACLARTGVISECFTKGFYLDLLRAPPQSPAPLPPRAAASNAFPVYEQCSEAQHRG
jgi:hypothetical protein